MFPEPLVTIITPSFNQGRFIRHTIESILTQDYPNLEYIVVDGGSSDETATIVREYRDRLTWISEPDRGQAHAINKGFARARGEIVAWVNSDDLLLPGAVSRAVCALERHPRCGAVYGEGYLLDEAGRITRRFPATEPFNLWKLVHLSDYILQQTVYFRRSEIEAIGYLDETLHYGLDWDLLIRLGKRCPLAYIPDLQGCLREYPEAKTFSGGTRRAREIGRILRRHTGLRYPPGYITYGLETLQRRSMHKLDHSNPRWLRVPAVLLSLLVYVSTAWIIMRTLRDAQGWYPDRWAAPRLHWMLPPGTGSISIRGSLPDGSPRLRGQTLSVFLDGALASKAQIEFGDFEIVVPAHSPTAPLTMEVRASRYLRPPFGSEFSLRPMSYLLKSIDWTN